MYRPDFAASSSTRGSRFQIADCSRLMVDCKDAIIRMRDELKDDRSRPLFLAISGFAPRFEYGAKKRGNSVR